MKYMGSKNRIAKHILPIMLKYKTPEMTWVEPFVGGANMIDKMEGKRIGADISEHLIKALCLVRDEPHKIPKNNTEYTEEMFNNAKQSDLSNPVDCFAMFQYTFGSIFKGSWAKNKRGTDYVRECVKNVLLQSKKIQDVCFINSKYRDLQIPQKSIIYCDPPYEGTAKYKTEDFNHADFWQWCREKTNEGHIVFVSEYNAPEDFYCIWEQEIKSILGKNNNKNAMERLFTPMAAIADKERGLF
jgi:DNA adenine methylase